MKQMGYFFKKTTALLIALVMCISAVCAVPAVAEEKEGNADKTDKNDTGAVPSICKKTGRIWPASKTLIYRKRGVCEPPSG